jgi:hypothetical protein
MMRSDDFLELIKNRIITSDKPNQWFFKNRFTQKRVFHLVVRVVSDFVFNGPNNPFFVRQRIINAQVGVPIQDGLRGQAHSPHLANGIFNSFNVG